MNDAITPDQAIKPFQGESLAVVQRMRPAMGTLCVIEACGDSEVAHQGLARAFAAVAHIEQCMHPTRVGSDLVRLKNSAGSETKVDVATWAVLSTARRLHLLSEGVFDPCLPCLPGRVIDLELLPDSLATSHVPMAIDLGGIAKGYAIDEAIAALQAVGCISGMVNIGGDLRVFGEEPRQILVRMQQTQSLHLSVCNTALAVSDMDSLNRPTEHQGYYRRNHHSAPIHTYAAVLAQQAIIADALTKCVMFCSEAVLQNMLDKLDATLARVADPHYVLRA